MPERDRNFASPCQFSSVCRISARATAIRSAERTHTTKRNDRRNDAALVQAADIHGQPALAAEPDGMPVRECLVGRLAAQVLDQLGGVVAYAWGAMVSP
jgi:hypothetical protein